MPRGRPKGTKNRVKGVDGELLPSVKEVGRIAVLGRCGGRGYEFDFEAGLAQRAGILMPLPGGASFTVTPAVAGEQLGDDDEDGDTFCTFIYSDGWQAPCRYSERDGTAYVEIIDIKSAPWLEN